ncbi:MAG: hypothetical protein CMF48_04085 [Legionellales bacterium]|nr:hypothetical protein [Legionellales bacterium]
MKELNYMECVAVTGATNSDATSGKPPGDKDPVPANVRENLKEFNSSPTTGNVFVRGKSSSSEGNSVSAGVNIKSENFYSASTATYNSKSNEYSVGTEIGYTW